MKILVTGALGHIGSRFIREVGTLLPGVSLELVDSLMTQRYCSLFNLPKNIACRFHEGDVISMPLGDIMKSVDVVLHLAAVTDATSSVLEPDKVKQNIVATKRVAQLCAQNDKALIFSSSTSVYGTQKEIVDENCSEEDLKPQSPYAEIKIAEENLLQVLGSEQGLRYTICRFGTICGTSPGMRFHTAINKFCWQAVMKQPITVWKTALHQRRPYLELSDACRAVAHIIRSNIFDRSVYNVLTDNLTVQEIISMIETVKHPVEVKFVDAAIMNQLSYTVARSRFEASGFEFCGSIAGAIADTVDLLSQSNAG